ncbi:Ig-like domain-containing protein [Pararhodonellum marinum]|uniref:Ig-like domain-containing protein n=1 Tax=Pararhodonellum marinum TaxID=2755358 RepID=UPI00188F5CD8|nr:Ig-like domain-containing protein [Pararhodonellum marinum]
MKTLVPKLLLLMIGLVLHQTIFAASYYFSDLSGNDSRSAAEAQNPDTPWKSIDKLNAIFNSLQPGDQILFKRGETFYGSIRMSKSGTNGAPIVFSAYGSGAKPIITSLVKLGDWKSMGNNIFESTDPRLGNDVTVLVFNGKPQEMGRFPNAKTGQNGYVTIKARNGNTSVTSDELSGAPNVTGGEVVIRKNHWVIDRHQITSHAGNTINYGGGGSNYQPANNFGFFVQNHFNTLDIQGEWYYNPNGKRMNVHFGGTTPNNADVRVSTLENLVSNTGNVSNVVFENLEFRGANRNAFYLTNTTRIAIKNCDIHFSGQHAIHSIVSNEMQVENNVITHSYNGGLFLQYNDVNTRIRGNKFDQTYMFQGMGRSGDLNGNAIYAHADSHNHLIEFNEFTQSGYQAIYFGGNNTIVRNNFVDGFCLVKDDGAGIYTYTGNSNTNYTNREISYNIVVNGPGAVAGTPYYFNGRPGQAEGIYLDDNSSGINIFRNSIANVANHGIFIHNARNLDIYDNTFYNANYQVAFAHDNLGNPIRNVTVRDNVFFAKLASQNLLFKRTNKDDMFQMGNLDRNRYVRPFDDGVSIVNSRNTGGSWVTQSYDLEGWKKASGKDQNSKGSPVILTPYEIKKITGNNQFANGTFNANLNGSYCYSPQNNCKTTWLNGKLDGGAIQVESPNTTNVIIGVGAVNKSKHYVLKLSAMSNKNANIQVFLRQSNAPYAALTPVSNLKLDTKRQELETVLSFPNTEANASIVFLTNDPGLTYWMDNIELREVDAALKNPDDYFLFEYNKTGSDKSVGLNGAYVDAFNNSYSGSVTIKPFQSVLLIRTSQEPGEDEAPLPSVEITSPQNKSDFDLAELIDITVDIKNDNGKIQKIDYFTDAKLIGTVNSKPYNFTWKNATSGVHFLIAKATLEGGKTVESEPVEIYVQEEIIDIVLFKVNLSALPADGGTVATNPGPTEVEAGQKVKVVADSKPGYAFEHWTVDGSKVSEQKIYEFTMPSNDISLTAVFRPLIAPTIQITSPDQNAVFESGTPIVIKVIAEDEDGKVSKVDFFRDNTLIGSSNNSPFDFEWKNAPNGKFALTAKAMDDDGLVTTSNQVEIEINGTNIAPEVSITSPVHLSDFEQNADIEIKVDASDPDGEVTQVEFYRGNTLLGTVSSKPYTYVWKNVPAGDHALTAKAFDDKGLSKVSEAVQIKVNGPNQAPAVKITSPANLARFAQNADIEIKVDASDPDGEVTKVEFYSGNTLLGTVSSKPYTYVWKNVPAGDHALTAKAFDDKGLRKISEAVQIKVNGPNQAPAVKITSPANLASFAQNADIEIKVDASDPDGEVTKVEFYSGNTLLGTVSSKPYTYVWKNVPTGDHALTAKAFDDKGLSKISEAVQIKVNGPNQAPVVKITSPANLASFAQNADIEIKVDASDPDGEVAKVEFYRGNTLLGTVSNKPFTFVWKNVPAGNYSLSAKAFDDKGLSRTSTVINIVVNAANVAPSIQIISPTNLMQFQAPTDVEIKVEANDSDGKVSKVEFFRGNTLLGTSSNEPFTFVWKDAPVGSHSLTAKATDDKGLSKSSTVVNITVVAAEEIIPPSVPQTPQVIENEPPLIWFTAPGNEDEFEAGTNVTLEVEAFDPDGEVVKVDYYFGDQFLGSNGIAPFEFVWEDIPVGTHSVTAIATDNDGAETKSEALIIHGLEKEALIVIKIGPNPAENELKVFIEGLPEDQEMEVYVISLQGNIEISFDANTTDTVLPIDIRRLKPGAYVLRLVSGDFNFSTKFIKKR